MSSQFLIDLQSVVHKEGEGRCSCKNAEGISGTNIWEMDTVALVTARSISKGAMKIRNLTLSNCKKNEAIKYCKLKKRALLEKYHAKSTLNL